MALTLLVRRVVYVYIADNCDSTSIIWWPPQVVSKSEVRGTLWKRYCWKTLQPMVHGGQNQPRFLPRGTGLNLVCHYFRIICSKIDQFLELACKHKYCTYQWTDTLHLSRVVKLFWRPHVKMMKCLWIERMYPNPPSMIRREVGVG